MYTEIEKAEEGICPYCRKELEYEGSDFDEGTYYLVYCKCGFEGKEYEKGGLWEKEGWRDYI